MYVHPAKVVEGALPLFVAWSFRIWNRSTITQDNPETHVAEPFRTLHSTIGYYSASARWAASM